MTLNKGLELNGGVLYVDGDLAISGGVDGYGAVFCTGSMRVSGGGTLATDSLCALVAGGGLSISGAGADKTQFRGLVYSAGALNVSDITVVGSLVGSSASGAPMTVVRSNLLFDPKAVVMDLDLQWSGFGSINPLTGGVTLNPTNSLTPNSFFRDGEYEMPTNDELRQIILLTLPPEPARPPTDAEISTNMDVAERVRIMRRQIEELPNAATSTGSFQLDLNQFVKVQSRMKIVSRRFESY